MHAKIAKKTSKMVSTTPNAHKEKESNVNPGAFDSNYIYLVRFKDGDFREAKIVETKLIEDPNNTNSNIQRTPSSYKYYVHYVGFNRRLDEWVMVDRMKKTDRLIENDKANKKSKFDDATKKRKHSSDDEGLDPQSRKMHEQATKIKTVTEIVFGRHRAETWYFSPFPEKYHVDGCLYFCEYCLSFYVTNTELERHMISCKLVCPPGDQIYVDEERQIAIFEVDAIKNWAYCENLSYLAKLFLDHKFLLYNLDPFLFYVLTEIDEYGYHFVGYFSKNRELSDPHNLSCILMLPFFQKKGYGKFLINFSYELSMIEGKVGTPEKPLSDLGRASYISYWVQRLIDYFNQCDEEKLNNMTINTIAKDTGIKDVDIIEALETVKIIKKVAGNIYLCLDKVLLEKLYRETGRPAIPVNVDKIHWIPYKQKYDN